MRAVPVVDPDDPRLDDYRHLNDTRWRRRYEAEQGIFVAEGPLVVERLLHSTLATRSVLVERSRLDRVIPSPAEGVPVYAAPAPIIERVVGFDLHRGVVAVGERPFPPPLGTVLELGSAAILEGINDHENLGSSIRAGAALGVEGFLLDPGCADPWYRRSVRVSMGAVMAVPIATCSDLPATLARVKAAGFTIFALTPSSSASDIRELTRDPRRRVALMVGAEGPGLSEAALAAADHRIRIAMTPLVDSLNVSHALAVAAFHLCRPRMTPPDPG